MLFSVSMALIFFITSLVIFYTYIKRKFLTSMTGMIVSMTNSMMTSVAFGTILGISLKDKDITFPTMVSVSIGIIVGYFTGRPVSIKASLEGIMAGIMGGLMGAMLGVMLSQQSAGIMVYFIDIIDIMISILLFRVMDEEIKTKHKDPSNNIPLIVKLIVFITFLILTVLLVNLNLKLL